jgi:hypothetical protein
MQFMILRKADEDTEAGVLPSAALLKDMGDFNQQLVDAGVMRAGEGLHPSASGVRVKLARGQVSVVDGPFTETKELIAGFSIIDVPSRQDAIDWVKRWPALDGGGDVEVEIRETGCPGGCAEVGPPPGAARPEGKRFVLLLRSDQGTEADAVPERRVLDTLDAHNAVEAKAGVLLAGDGLKSTAKGARVKFSAGKPAVVDGPFTEAKELIAGYWMIRVASIQDAIAWARRVPYPTGPEVEVEIRQVYEAEDFGAEFTPELREAEQRMRAQLLESGMRAELAAAPLAWR